MYKAQWERTLGLQVLAADRVFVTHYIHMFDAHSRAALQIRLYDYGRRNVTRLNVGVTSDHEAKLHCFGLQYGWRPKVRSVVRPAADGRCRGPLCNRLRRRSSAGCLY